MKTGFVGEEPVKEEKKEIAAAPQTGFTYEQMVEMNKQMIQTLFAEIKKKDTDNNIVDSFDKIDKEDMLEVPEVWFAPYVNYVISTDKRGGKDVKLPFNMDSLVFKYHATNKAKKQNHMEDTITNFSRLIVSSKTLSNWLRSSSFYKVSIFPEMKSIKGLDNRLTTLTQKYIHAFYGKGQTQMFQEALALKLDVSSKDNLTDIKIAIASELARREYDNEIQANFSRAINSSKADFLAKGGDEKEADNISIVSATVLQ